MHLRSFREMFQRSALLFVAWRQVALSHALSETIWAHPARARTGFAVCQNPVTPERRRSKRPVVPTTAQLQHVPISFPARLLLLSAHVLLRLTANPPFMCTGGSFVPAQVTALTTLSHIVVSYALPPLVCSTYGLFCPVVCFCLFVSN